MRFLLLPRGRCRVIVAVVVLLCGAATNAQSNSKKAPDTAHHVLVKNDALVWKPLHPGSETAVVSGDPAKPGLFVMRFRYHGPVRIPPHWHPNDEHITVLSGTFALGMGEKADERAVTELTAGGYALAHARMAHYAWARGASTLLQVHGMGPFTITYVNPEDNPNRPAAQKK